MKKETQTKKNSNAALFILGSIAVATGAFLIIPKVIESGSDYIYKQNEAKKGLADDDDWGPEIVKTSELEVEDNG